MLCLLVGYANILVKEGTMQNIVVYIFRNWTSGQYNGVNGLREGASIYVSI